MTKMIFKDPDDGVIKTIRTFDVDKLISAINKRLSDELLPMVKKILELEKRIALSQEQGKYVGVYLSGHNYKKGNFCTHSGSLWVCKQDTQSRPGTNSDWQLCAKGGHGKWIDRTD